MIDPLTTAIAQTTIALAFAIGGAFASVVLWHCIRAVGFILSNKDTRR